MAPPSGDEAGSLDEAYGLKRPIRRSPVNRPGASAAVKATIRACWGRDPRARVVVEVRGQKGREDAGDPRPPETW